MISIELSKRFKKIVREAGREQEVSSTLRHIPPLIAARHHIHGKRPPAYSMRILRAIGGHPAPNPTAC